jgi:hypothetical protein
MRTNRSVFGWGKNFEGQADPPSATYIDWSSNYNHGVGIVIPATTDGYLNCDESTEVPLLTSNDIVCYQQKRTAGDLWADCDLDGVLTAADYLCFITRFNNALP